MKYLPIFLLIIILVSTKIINAVQAYGIIERDIITTNTIERYPLYYVSDKLMYTTGGVTFVYPTGLFSLPPVIQISIEPGSAHPTNQTYTVEISTNSATSTTVMVYFIDTSIGVSINEAPNASAMVHLYAIQDPV